MAGSLNDLKALMGIVWLSIGWASFDAVCGMPSTPQARPCQFSASGRICTSCKLAVACLQNWLRYTAAWFLSPGIPGMCLAPWSPCPIKLYPFLSSAIGYFLSHGCS